MKLQLRIVLLFFVVLLVSCGNNEPKVYTSISGSWRCEETYSLGGSNKYFVEIFKAKSGAYLISNFYNVGTEGEFDINATLNNSTLTINSQQIGGTQNLVRSGTGEVSSDFKRIILNYKIYDGLNDIDVSAVYSR